MSGYDIYLDDIGYMLAKDAKGRLLSGAAREQIVDPFTQFLARDEPYSRASFRFGDGIGLTHHDGSHRAMGGNGVDARSGKLIMAPERLEIATPEVDREVGYTSTPYDIPISTAGNSGVAERFQVPAGTTTLRSIALLLKRDENTDYSSASDFSVKVYTDDPVNYKPVAPVLGTIDVSIKKELALLFADRWRNGEYFWLEVVFDTNIVMAAGTYFWIGVFNAQAPKLYWSENQGGATTYWRSVYPAGTAWQNGTQTYPLYVKVGYKDGPKQYDSFPRCFQVFRGANGIEYMYCGTAYRILYYDAIWGGGHWWESKTIGTAVTQLLEYKGKLYAACGPTTDFWYSDGSVPGSPAWTQHAGFQANAFAIHDNLFWKADVAVVQGTDDPTGIWNVGNVEVGDGNKRVRALVSHGGKLYAVKPEGVFEISYPDTYPTDGDPTCNLMLDFNTEKCPRNWVLDWHSGLYFPGLGGIYELKSGILRNAWADKVDEGALDASVDESAVGRGDAASRPRYTRPRSWAPLYDKGPVAWSAAHGTTRGILLARSNPHLNTSDLLWYDGRNWYSMRSAGDVNSYGDSDVVGEYITACFVQDAGGGRGWLWYNEGFKLCRTEWPTWTDDTVDDGTVEYERFGTVDTPWFSLTQQSKDLLLCKVGLVSENLATGTRTVKVWYYTEADSAVYNNLGTIQASDYAELNFPAGTTARRVRFRLILDTGASSSQITPILEQLDLFYQIVPDETKTHQLIISCAGDLALREGGVDQRTAGEIVADLEALLGAASFAYVDPLGRSKTVRVTALTMQYMDLLTGPGPESVGVEAQAILNLLEV